MRILNIFKVFLEKNLLYIRYKWLSLLIVFLGCLTIHTIYLKSTYQLLTTPLNIHEFKNTELLKQDFPANDGDAIFYNPAVPFTAELMERVRQELQLPAETLKAFESQNEMIIAMDNCSNGNCFAVDFETIPSEESSSLNYSISSTAIRLSPKKRYVNDEEVNGIKDYDEYIRTGFLTLQHLIDRIFIEVQSKGESSNIYEIAISSLPSISVEVMDSQRVILFGSFFVVLLSVLLISTFLVPLVEEKQDGLKEFLVIATPFNFLNGLTFFLVLLCLYLLFLIASIVTAYIYQALGIVPIVYIVILFVLYIISTMAYTYLISVCFNSVFYAKVGGLLLIIIPIISYMTNGKLSVLASFIFSTKCFLDGMNVFQIFTNKYRSFGFSDLFVNITQSSFSIFSIYAILFFQCFFYAILYNYLSLVFPGPGGLKRPYLFFLNKSFYMKRQRNQYTTSERGQSDIAIIIQDLVKKVRKGTREVVIANRLNLDIKNKQITVLLGHNGVGKTTTLNMIMGSVPKDSGKIIVCSERDVSSYRHLIGFCPQHNVFMHYMTCAQHIKFFSQLRGLSKDDATKFSDELLKQLKLSEKKNEYGINLSGGMKRRLSLGIALSGNTKVVVLDEPSSGLDINARRVLWDVLLDLRKSKAILITTHHMEEAEVLGNTICILANGRLERTGSPLELKRKLGTGYILKLRVDSEKFDENETITLIRTVIPLATTVNIVPPTVLISLPYSSRNDYSKALKLIEEKAEDLRIFSITVSDSSLEDVFLNCSADVDQIDSPANNRLENCPIPYERLEHAPLKFSQQFCAVFYKKFIYLCNEKLYSLVMLSIAFLTVGLAILLMHSMSMVGKNDALELNLKQIQEGVIYIYNPSNQPDYGTTLENELRKIIESNGINFEKLKISGENSVAEELIRIQQDNLAHFLQNVIGAIEILPSEREKIKFNVYFSGNIYHSSVILVNLIDNAMLRTETNQANNIETTYVPIERVLTDVSPARLEYNAVIVAIGLFFYMFYYVSLPSKEYKSNFNNLQAIPRIKYWLSVFCFDSLLHLFVCILLYIFQSLIMPPELYSKKEQFMIIISIFFYGLSYLPILYCLANAFRSISTLSTYLLFMLIISAITPLITSGNVQSMKFHETKIFFFSILPDFNLNHQLRVINENFLIERRNSLLFMGSGNARTQELLDVTGFFTHAIFTMAVVGVFFIYLWENKKKREDFQDIFSCYSCKTISKLGSAPSNSEEEELVKSEKSTVEDIIREKQEKNYPLVVHGLMKLYDQKLAVQGLNFAVKHKECFGLLGANGAGKSTTFQMLTANSTISSGSVQIDGIDIVKNEDEYKSSFGYCPQNDCLNNFMTSYQILKYVAQVRGIRNSEIHSEVMYWLIQLDLLRYKNICIRHYSGGTKRKLNAAIAMIGSPSVVFLDEPTTGVDPVSRRFLWKCIQDFQKRNKTVVLTSHSMDECEQLCNRLAIMAGGQFKCIGDVPDLKQRYGTGFTINMKMIVTNNDENVSRITEQLQSHFPDYVLRENHAGMLTYFIKCNMQISWASVFKKMELFLYECADLIEDYSVNETKLEDIFLKFYKNNRQETTSNFDEV